MAHRLLCLARMLHFDRPHSSEDSDRARTEQRSVCAATALGLLFLACLKMQKCHYFFHRSLTVRREDENFQVRILHIVRSQLDHFALQRIQCGQLLLCTLAACLFYVT